MLALSVSACGFEPPAPNGTIGPPPLEAPRLQSIERSEARVGEVLRFAGTGFIAPEEGWVEITVRGSFVFESGAIDAVTTMAAELLPEEGQVEARFGPWNVPFVASEKTTGLFRGRAFATNRAFDGRAREQEESTWPDVELTVLPSIVVGAFEPKLFAVELVPPDAVAGTPYRLSVEAVGFSLASIEYRLGPGVLIDGDDVDMVIHDALGTKDTLGDRELLSFAPVPEGDDEYVAPIVIRASSDTGESVSLELNAVVH